MLLMLVSCVCARSLVFAGEILSINLLGMTTVAADGRKRCATSRACSILPREGALNVEGGSSVLRVRLPWAVGLLLICSAFGLARIADVRDGVLHRRERSADDHQLQARAGRHTDRHRRRNQIVLALLAGVLNAVAGAVLCSTPSRR